MARQVVENITCDMKGEHEGEVSNWRIAQNDGHTWEIDLCEKHDDSLAKYLEYAREATEKKRARKSHSVEPYRPQ